jgi:hypothetical protein
MEGGTDVFESFTHPTHHRVIVERSVDSLFDDDRRRYGHGLGYMNGQPPSAGRGEDKTCASASSAQPSQDRLEQRIWR